MSYIGKFSLSLNITDGFNSVLNYGPKRLDFPVTVIQEQQVVLTASVFTALTVPAGAKFGIIDTGGAASLTLKGITGDSGVAGPTVAIPAIPYLFPINGAVSVGILNGVASNVTATVIWFG